MKRLDESNIKDFLSSIDTFLLDCDGVLWRSSDLIDGVKDTLQFLRKQGKKLVFVTNNSTTSRVNFLKKVESFGLEASKEEIFSSAYATAAFLHERGFKGKVYIVGEGGIGDELKEFNIPFHGGVEHRGEHSLEDIEKIQIDKETKAVVVGLDRFFNYYKLTYAKLCLSEIEGCEYIATNTDSTLPGKNEVMLPGAGSIVNSITTAADRVPKIIGKPHKSMMDILIRDLKLDPSRTCMVGDRLETGIFVLF
eukprot:TRINITY_DN4098_c0_g1_i1.p1 TRINITY_DN4098_c0_g1~~TRINITY_DN4098_c0_g1_i1.p1  ORF type:complete len:251 (-),score=59.58 TRINITY_DN4098_c0_g1_i1:238-990(-)